MSSIGTSKNDKLIRWGKIVLSCAGILLSVLWVVQLVYLRSSPIASNGPLGDEAIFSQGALRVLHGQVPHRDFVSITGGLSYYPLAGAFFLFGESYNVVRAFSVVTALLILTLILWLVWPLSRMIAALTGAIFLLVMFPIWPYASYHWTFVCVALLSIGLLLRSSSRRTVVLAAVLLGLVSFSVFNRAVPLFFALTAFLYFFSGPRDKRKQRTYFFIGAFGTTCLAIILWLWQQGSLVAYVQQVFIDNAKYYRFATPETFFVFNHTLIILLLTVVTLSVPFLIRGMISARLRPTYIALWLAHLSLSISTLYYLEPVHLTHGMLPGLMLALLLFRDTVGVHVPRARQVVVATTLLAILVVMVEYSRDVTDVVYSPSSFSSLQTTISLQTPRGTLYGNTKWHGTFASAIPALTPIIEGLKGKRVFFLPFCPGCYYFYDLDNPTPMDVVPTDRMAPEERAWLERTLEEDTDVVVFIPPTWPSFDKQSDLMKWINERFVNQASYYNGQIIVMEKNQ